MESLITKRFNPMVRCMTFHTTKQENTESVQDFLIHFQAASPDCAFNFPDC